jgi:hypothetical protein
MLLKKCRTCKEPKPRSEFFAHESRKNKRGEPWLFAVCKTCTSSERKDRRKEKAAAGICWLCGKPRDNKTQKCSECVQKQYLSDKRRNAEIKDMVFAAYGGYKCACPCGCDVTEPEYLHIDHINGGGVRHRKEIRTNQIYRWLMKNNFPAGYRVLCANCNTSRGRLGSDGLCPKERQRLLVPVK